MNNTALIDLTAQVLGSTKKSAAATVDAVLASIVVLTQREPLTLRGFGRFEMRTRAARVVRSRVTGTVDQFSVPARTNLSFKASPSLRTQ